MNKLSFLIAVDYYLPGFQAGGPIKSVSLLCENLNTKFDITVLTSNSDLDGILYKIENDCLVDLGGYDVVYLSKMSMVKVYKQISLSSPNIIYLNSFFSKFTQIILLLRGLKLISAKIILAPRGELSKGALSIKAKKKSAFLRLVKWFGFYNNLYFHATDETESKDIKAIFLNPVLCVPNLAYRSKQHMIVEKNVNELRLVFLSRISRKKNLLYALKVLKEIDDKRIENVIFDIYGTKEDKEYWLECKGLINTFKYVIIRFKGEIKPKNIAKTLSRYHLFFLPTMNENFGHAIVEAMQNGLVQLISNQTPWNDLGGDAGYTLDLSDKDAFVQAVIEMLACSQEDFIQKSDKTKAYINRKIDNTVILEKYIEMFTKVSK